MKFYTNFIILKLFDINFVAIIDYFLKLTQAGLNLILAGFIEFVRKNGGLKVQTEDILFIYRRVCKVS